MKQDVVHGGEGAHAVSHRKPKHTAEKIETWMGRAFVLLGAVMLAVLVFAFMQTGSGTPSWMH
jgi:hypothetical protein